MEAAKLLLRRSSKKHRQQQQQQRSLVQQQQQSEGLKSSSAKKRSSSLSLGRRKSKIDGERAGSESSSSNENDEALERAIQLQRRASIGHGATVKLAPQAVDQVRKLRHDVDSLAYTGQFVKEEWLEIALTALDGELRVVNKGRRYKKLTDRIVELNATDTPRFFVGVARQSKTNHHYRTFVYRWTGSSQGNMKTLRLATSMAFTSILNDLTELMSADVVLQDVASYADVTKKALMRRPRARQARIDGTAVGTLAKGDTQLTADFISRNKRLASVFKTIRQNMSSESLTWMVLGYHAPSNKRSFAEQYISGSIREDHGSDREDDFDGDNEGDGLGPFEDDDEDEEAEFDSYNSGESWTDSSTDELPLALPALLAYGGGGIDAFGEGGIMDAVDYRPGWLYWIYARVEVDSIEGTGRFRARSHSFVDGTGPVGGCKFLLITYHDQTERGVLPSMAMRLNEHHRVITNIFKHHIHIEASSPADLSEESIVQRLVAHIGGNRIVLTVNVGTGSGGTLQRIMHVQRETMSAPLLIRINPRARLLDLKTRIAQSYSWDTDCVLIMRVARKPNRDVMSALIASSANARSEAELDETLRKAASQVEVQPLEGDEESLTDLGLVSGEELYVKLVKKGSKRDSQRFARQMNEIPLAERRRVAIEHFVAMRDREQRLRMPLFTSLRHFTEDDIPIEDDSDGEIVREVVEKPAELIPGTPSSPVGAQPRPPAPNLLANIISGKIELRKVSTPPTKEISPMIDDEARYNTSDALLAKLIDEAQAIGAPLIEDEDLIILNKKALGDGKTAKVFEGVLLCKVDQIHEAALGPGRKSRAVSTRESWARLRNRSITADADTASQIMDAATDDDPDDRNLEFVAIKVAVKRFSARVVTESVYNAFLEEIRVLVQLHDVSIVQILGVYIDSATRREKTDDRPLLMICYELMPRGSLAQLRKTSEWHDLPFTYKLMMALRIAKGIRFLHTSEPPVAHRDLKSDNLLVDEDFSMKIGDFGTSTRVTEDLHDKLGTAGWTAPEILDSRFRCYDHRCDIFSFGIILWEFVTSEPNPLRGIPEEKYLEQLNKGCLPDLPPGIDREYAELTMECQQYDPKDRPTADEIVESLNHILHRRFKSKELLPEAFADSNLV